MRALKASFFFLFVLTSLFLFHYPLFVSLVRIHKPDLRMSAYHSGAQKKIIVLNWEDLYKNTRGLQWKDHNKEVVIDGAYYEVAAIRQDGRQALVQLVPDYKETRLFQDYFEFGKKQDQRSAQLSILFLSLMFTENQNPFCFQAQTAPFLFWERPVQHATSPCLSGMLRPPQV